MASGSKSVSPTSHHTLTFNWWSTGQSINNNATNISWEIILYSDQYGRISSSSAKGWSVYIDGQPFSGTNKIAIGNNANVVLARGSTTISHNENGQKSFSFSFRQEFSINFNGWVGEAYGDGSGTLDTIPRASYFGKITGNTIGSNMTVEIIRYSSSFQHQLWYKIKDSGWYDLGTGIGTSHTFTIDKNLCNKITDGVNVALTLCLRTYNGSNRVGNDLYKDVTVSVPSNVKPTLGSVRFTIDNSGNSVIDEWGVGIVGYSRVQIEATASGSYGSAIKSFIVSSDNDRKEISVTNSHLDYNSDVLKSSGDKTFNIVAKDSRGRLSEQKSSAPMTIYAYSVPSISSFVVERSSTAASKMVVKANWTFSSINEKNHSIATLYYKKQDSSGWSIYGTIEKNTSTTLTNDFSEELSYSFRLVVRDDIGNAAQAETFVSTIDVLMDFRAGGKGLGIGKIAETDNLEIALDSIFMGNISIKDGNRTIGLNEYIQNIIGDYIVEQGEKDSWIYRKWNSGIAECWRSEHISAQLDSQWGSLYTMNNATPALMYPFIFTDVPIETVSLTGSPRAGNTYQAWICLSSDYSQTNEKTARYQIVRTSPITENCPYQINYHVVGRWEKV